MMRRAAFHLSIVFALSGCAGSGSHVLPGLSHSGASTQSAPLGSKIQHVIVVLLENRSFDNIFDADTALANVTDPPVNVDSTLTGMSKTGQVSVLPDTLSASSFDEDHSHGGFLSQFDGGKNDGWPTGTQGGYGYVPASEVQPYYDIAAESAISDNFFHSVTGPTFPSHLFVGAGSTFGVIGNPSSNTWGCDAKAGTVTDLYNPNVPGEVVSGGGPFPSFDDLSIFDLLDRGGITWRYYVGPEGDDITGNLNIAGYFRHIRYGSDWNNDVATTDAQVLTDLAGGSLRQVSFVIPNDGSTDHAGEPSLGPTYIKTLVNAFGSSQYYNNSIMLITWDDWGGWYDHVAPPKRADGSQLSFRKPLIIVGGLVKHNYCTHVQTEDASIDKTLEEVFNLGTLGQYDVSAAGLDDAIDITQTPPAFSMITSVQGAAPAPGAPTPPVLSSPARPAGYFRVIPADFMKPGGKGAGESIRDDYYAQRAADY